MDAALEAKLDKYLVENSKGVHEASMKACTDAIRAADENASLMKGAFGTDSYGALALQQGTNLLREVVAVGIGLYAYGKIFGKDDDKII